ncbi:MAG: hypothetical protein KatS3mg009_3292 [Acidimicrobiia bacterium]|nr:MAG: hypothetical protein KatS3mg009_3292 [Acidimicrobiia bacterium]
MKDYCDILRSHDATDQLSVQVLRFADGARYRGELNGDALEPVESLVGEVESQARAARRSRPVEAYEYTTVHGRHRAAGRRRADGMGRRADRDRERRGTGEYAQILAAPDVQQFLETFDVPGMSFAIDLAARAARSTTGSAASDYSSACTERPGPRPYDDGLYTGTLQVWYRLRRHGRGARRDRGGAADRASSACGWSCRRSPRPTSRRSTGSCSRSGS